MTSQAVRIFFMVGYHKTQSFKEILTRLDVTVENRTAFTGNMKGHHKCGQCSVCFLNLETKTVVFAALGYTHELHHFSNCKTKMFIYLLTCKCTLRYIGSTRHQLRICLQEHRSLIKNHVLEAPLI